MKRLLSILGPAALVVLTILLTLRLTSIVVDPNDPKGSYDAGRDGLGDFRDVIYFPLRAVQEGVNPYDCGKEPLLDGSQRYLQRYPVLNLFPLYSPLVFLLYWPFSWLDFHTSAIFYVALNFVLAVVLAYVIARLCAFDRDANGQTQWGLVCALATLILVTQAGRSNFMGGENALPLTLASLGAIVWGRDRPWLAGAAIALSSMKPTYGLPLGFFMLCRGDWKAVTIGWAASIAIGIGGLLLVFGQTGDIPHMVSILKDNQAVLESDPEADARSTSSRIDSAGVLVRLIPGDMPGESIATSLLLSALTAVVIIGAQRIADPTARDTVQWSAIAVGTVTCLYRLPYDALLLWLPISLAFFAPSQRWGNISTTARMTFGFLAIAPMFNLLTSSTAVKVVRSLGLDRSLPSAITEGAWTAACSASGAFLLAALCTLAFLIPRSGSSKIPATNL
jgi:NADH:ubiquinone oxidoreductase subunit 3 (subunit A)